MAQQQRSTEQIGIFVQPEADGSPGDILLVISVFRLLTPFRRVAGHFQPQPEKPFGVFTRERERG
ncbi:hypothetical protein ZHAS_00020416 [Anopheles sinensis]|uniref:Uncharacterized protein n=1 Tax=Anopheles sinensis TaxID=74873 RepID=A0A084WQ02_ANOSI|nr:hypothetical protein ZHAS_00020416 [Anopheles sinensis]